MEILLCIFIAYALGSLGEYWLHLAILHNPKAKGFYKAHTVHHKTYPIGHFNFPRHPGLRHKNIVICLEHILVFMLPLALILIPFWPELSITLVVFSTLHYFYYNKVHTAMHLRHRITWMPKRIQELIFFTHFMHHQHPQKWFPVSLPFIWDWVLGTACPMTEKDKHEWEVVKAHLAIVNERQDRKKETKDLEKIEELDDCIMSTRYLKNGKVSEFSGLLTNVRTSEKPTIYYANHISWRDPIILAKKLRARTKVHQNVMNFLGLGLILGPLFGFFSVNRGKGEAVAAGVKVLKELKQPLLIFPEGVTNLSNQKLKPFKSGLGRIIKEVPEVELVPVKIEYEHYMPEWIEKFPHWIQFVLTMFTRHAYCGYSIKIMEPVVNGVTYSDIGIGHVKIDNLSYTFWEYK